MSVFEGELCGREGKKNGFLNIIIKPMTQEEQEKQRQDQRAIDSLQRGQARRAQSFVSVQSFVRAEVTGVSETIRYVRLSRNKDGTVPTGRFLDSLNRKIGCK
jgi:hypothetical protein